MRHIFSFLLIALVAILLQPDERWFADSGRSSSSVALGSPSSEEASAAMVQDFAGVSAHQVVGIVPGGSFVTDPSSPTWDTPSVLGSPTEGALSSVPRHEASASLDDESHRESLGSPSARLPAVIHDKSALAGSDPRLLASTPSVHPRATLQPLGA